MKRIKQVIVFTLIVSLLSGCAAIDQMVEAIDQARKMVAFHLSDLERKEYGR